nr:VWA domain-containing protein [Spirochaeta isovalerica]
MFLLLLIPLIILLHILFRRMESTKVSSLLIWEKVRKKRKYRIPSFLILLLQILTVTILSLSLADIKVPFTIPLRRENSVLLIDNSASMNVVEDGKSRLEDAKEKAINVIRGSLGEAMIVTSSFPPKIVSSYSQNHDELIDAINSIEATDLVNGIEEAMKIASASVTPEGSIIMISDGAFDYLPSETDNFKFIRAGKEYTGNTALTDFYLREKANSKSYELYLQISNFSDESVEFEAEIMTGNEIIEILSGNLDPWSDTREIIELEAEPESEISAVLKGKDLLDSDNRASAYISSNSRKRILLVTPGNFFLEKALESIPEIYLERFSGMQGNDESIAANTVPMLYNSAGIPMQDIPDNFDLVIYDRIPPRKNNPNGRFMYIDILPSGIRDERDKVRPQAVAISERHPVTDSLDLSGISILQARAPLAGPNIRELVSGGNTGLLYALESRFLKFVYIPFDLTDSDLPLNSSFPVLISNAVNWLTEGYARKEINQSGTGEPLSVGIPDPLYRTANVTLPTGQKLTNEGNRFIETVHTGLYKVEYGDDFQFFSVNLNNSDESDISSRFPEVTEEDREEKTGEYKFPLMSLLLILALAALSTEWMFQEAKW